MTTTAKTHTDGGIRIEGVTKTFRGPEGPVRAVRGIDVTIAAGETAALIRDLSVRAYFRAKVLTGYAMALSSLLILYISDRCSASACPPGAGWR